MMKSFTNVVLSLGLAWGPTAGSAAQMGAPNTSAREPLLAHLVATLTPRERQYLRRVAAPPPTPPRTLAVGATDGTIQVELKQHVFTSAQLLSGLYTGVFVTTVKQLSAQIVAQFPDRGSGCQLFRAEKEDPLGESDEIDVAGDHGRLFVLSRNKLLSAHGEMEAMVRAVKNGHGARREERPWREEAIVQDILRRGPWDLTEEDFWGRTPLYYASLVGSTPLVQLLLDHGAADDAGRTCHKSALNDAVRMLLTLHWKKHRKSAKAGNGRKKPSY